jgi:hypothetical protein
VKMLSEQCAAYKKDNVDAAMSTVKGLAQRLHAEFETRFDPIMTKEWRDRALAAEAELAACRAKLEGLREACALSEAEACYLSTYVSCDHDSPVAVIKRIQAALAATKPAEGPKAGETAVHYRREIDANGEPRYHVLPEPGTVLGSSYAAKMDSPLRRVEKLSCALGELQARYQLRCERNGELRKELFRLRRERAIPPEPVKPDEHELLHDRIHPASGRLISASPIKPASAEKPSLEERVGRHEQALRRILDALGKLTTEHGDSVTTVYGDTSLADAREALDRAVKGGGE